MKLLGENADKIQALIEKNNLSTKDLYDAQTTYESLWERAVNEKIIHFCNVEQIWFWDLEDRSKIDPDSIENYFMQIGDIVLDEDNDKCYFVHEIMKIIKKHGDEPNTSKSTCKEHKSRKLAKKKCCRAERSIVLK